MQRTLRNVEMLTAKNIPEHICFPFNCLLRYGEALLQTKLCWRNRSHWPFRRTPYPKEVHLQCHASAGIMQSSPMIYTPSEKVGLCYWVSAENTAPTGALRIIKASFVLLCRERMRTKRLLTLWTACICKNC